MNLERILAKVRELESVIEEETCVRNPIESVGLRAEFYDIFMMEYLQKIGPFVSFSDIYRNRINGIEYIPVFPSEKPESIRDRTIGPQKSESKEQHEELPEF